MSDRSAEWTLNPIVEREIGLERRRAVVRRRFAWLFVFSLGLCPFSCLGPFTWSVGEPSGQAILWVVFFAILFSGLTYAAALANEKDFTWRKSAALAENYADVRGWLVRLTIYQGDVPTGWDRGVVWFEEDRLLFVGERTSFGFAAGTTKGKSREGWQNLALQSEIKIPLRIRSRVGEVQVGFDLLNRTQAIDSFKSAVRGWLANPNTASEGQIPPLDLGPGAPTPGHLLRRALEISTFWTAVVFGGVASGLASGWLAFLPIVFWGTIFASFFWRDLWTPRLHWRAWRDRKRLEGEVP